MFMKVVCGFCDHVKIAASVLLGVASLLEGLGCWGFIRPPGFRVLSVWVGA